MRLMLLRAGRGGRRGTGCGYRLRSGLGGKITAQPLDPTALQVVAANGIPWRVTTDGEGDELGDNILILESTVPGVGLRDRHAIVADITHDEGGRAHVGDVGDW